MFLLVGSIRKHQVGRRNRRDWIFVAVSICCALISIAYLGVGLWDLIAENDRFNHLSWLVYFVRGLVWISLAVSLLVTKSKWNTVLIIVWWVSFSLLASALNIEILAGAHSIQVLDILPWPVNLLLLFCAFKEFSHFTSQQPPDESICEPLLGYSKPLNLEDIPSLVPEDEANIAYQKFAHAWDSLVREKNPNNNRNLVLWAVANVHFKENIFIGMCALLRTIAVVVLPLLLYAFVNYSNLDQQNLYHGLSIVACLLMVKIVESFSQRHCFFLSRLSGMKMRSALMVAVYQKQLKLSSLGRRRHSTGEIVNYIAVDAYRMGEFPWWFHLTWNFVLQLFLSIVILFGVVGLGALTGLVPLLICGLLNVPFARFLQKCQYEFMIAQDERLRATSEILNSMKIIKLQSWEDKFKSFIESHRDNEFKWLSKAQFRKAYSTLLYWLSPTIISSVIFLGCALFRSAPLNASTIFTVLATLRGMAEPVRNLPEALSFMIQVRVSLDRINTFLLGDELKNESLRTISSHNSDKSVRIQGGKFSWDPELMMPTLREVNLDVKWGQKIAICGPVGAGKSSLLYAILGEIPKISGTVDVFGSIAYVSQTSWIQSGTIRDNILYGKSMDEGKYEKAIKACALDKDINSFNHGDLTEIGQRGLNLSGGQKQRIQLARAVYNDADIYLLDDPFSAVDAQTAAILFNDCVMTTLENKTVILVTHQVEFLSAVDRIMVKQLTEKYICFFDLSRCVRKISIMLSSQLIGNGRGQITQSGSYEQLLKAGTAFEQLVNAHKDSITVLESSNDQSQGQALKVDMVRPDKSNTSYTTKQNSEGEISAKAVPGVQLTEEEEKQTGDVGWKPFLDYLIVSQGTLFVCLCILSQSGFVVFQAAATYWLAYAIQIPKMNSGIMIGVYTLISTLTPMLFFDSTPVGRILTRASSDLSVLDFDIPFSFTFVLAPLLELISIIAIMASVTWQVLIIAILALAGSKYVQDYYLASARELIRINGTTKAPVMNYAAETSLGVVTIRAFKMADRGNAECDFSHCLSSTCLLPKGVVAPGLVGLSLSYALSLTSTQVFLTRWYCNLANYMISVERIKQFMHIPPEPPAIVEDKRPPSSWPFKGRIELQELKVIGSSASVKSSFE
ncbi:hypothetical protein GH714_031105 [Hevea brasiliensis]|uniref:ABC-type xenobiotic transporter n=1 Tax=Hevea brasiliensis TaxID=3981 RepID=A0A6A6LLT2_HEVBR|nr:hypothetical protein GH714_031105 [Hevea brasiliensis]